MMLFLRLAFVWIPAALFDFAALCLILCIGHDFVYFNVFGLIPNNHAKGCGCAACNKNRATVGKWQDRSIPLFCFAMVFTILFCLWKYGSH
jgi:hypothetical protein